jgi:hypothetical protein
LLFGLERLSQVGEIFGEDVAREFVGESTEATTAPF